MLIKNSSRRGRTGIIQFVLNCTVEKKAGEEETQRDGYIPSSTGPLTDSKATLALMAAALSPAGLQ
jgi:hypothetical protein